jgi:23S rRNA pseudouridine2605 synthase
MKRNNKENERTEKRPRNASTSRADGKKPSEFNFFGGKGGSGRDGKPFGDRRESGERKPFGDRRESGERKPFGDRRESGDRKPFGDRRESGDRKPFGDREDRKPFGDRRESGDRKPFGDRRESGDRKPFGDRRESGDRKPFGDRRESGDRKPFGDRREYGDRKPFGDKRESDDRKPFGDRRESGDRKPFGDRRESGDRKPFGDRRESGDRKPFGDREDRRQFGDRRESGDRKPFGDRRESGDRKPFGDRRESGDRKPFGDREDKKPFGDRRESGDRKSFGERKPFGNRDNSEQNDENFGKRKFGKGRKPEDSFEYGNTGKPQRRPDYSEERMRDSLPPRQKAKIEAREKRSSDLVRLNRYIANAGLCSRREADDLIESGQITVNGKTITEMGYQVKPTDVVKYGRKILSREKLTYVLLNKPKDFITTTEDPEGRRTVMELVAKAATERIYPVGRLDRATTGLLLFTNDGELAEKLSHPSNEIRKIYQVEIDKPITSEDFEKLTEGVELEDGFVKPDEVSVITPDQQVIGIEIHSGKNRVVRRIFESLGYEVTKLDRTTYAGLNKKDLPRGNWRFLTEKEVIRLKYLI